MFVFGFVIALDKRSFPVSAFLLSACNQSMIRIFQRCELKLSSKYKQTVFIAGRVRSIVWIDQAA